MRKFLVVLDDSKECLNAIRYAALRAASTAGGVQVLSVIPAAEIQHGFGVAEVMRAEARDRIEAQFEVYAKWMRDRPGIEPELVVREGDPGGGGAGPLAHPPPQGGGGGRGGRGRRRAGAAHHPADARPCPAALSVDHRARRHHPRAAGRDHLTATRPAAAAGLTKPGAGNHIGQA